MRLSRWSGNNKCRFSLQRISLYFKAMPNSIDFCKEIFLHVIPARIIVPWFHSGHTNNTVFLICRKFTNGNLDEFKRQPFLESNSCMLGSIINILIAFVKQYIILSRSICFSCALVLLETVFCKVLFKDALLKDFHDVE